MEDDDLKSIWHDVLESIRVSVSQAIFTTWFIHTHLAELTDNNGRFAAQIGCNSGFTKQTIEGRYYGLIQDTLTKRLGNPCDILFIVRSKPAEPRPTFQVQKEEASLTPLFATPPSSTLLNEAITRSGLRKNYTFGNFAVSGSNQMAWAAAEAIAKEPGLAYNPLFIWGGVGVGKTHLMQAVGHSMLEKDINAHVLVCTGEQFTNEIVEGIRNKSTQSFRAKYRKLNALLIDDIQFIAGKDTVQEEFFHTFNALVGAGAQVILTSDRPPSEIQKLEERLKSRFEAGLIVDISPPDFELRCAILQIKAKERGFDLPMEYIHIIAGNVETARKMEGFLTKLTTEVRFKGKDITVELIESLVGQGSVEQDDRLARRAKTTPDDVITSVSKYYSIGKRALLGSSRAKPVARPRQVLMYLMRTHLQLPFQEVGRLVGGRDHTTVMHAVEKITSLASNTVDIRGDIEGIKKML